MNPSILFPIVGKIVGQTVLINLDMVTNLEEVKLWIQTSWTEKLFLCFIPTMVKELGK